MTTKLNRLKGCMLGLAIGDAMGDTVAAITGQLIGAYYGVDNISDT